MPHNNRRRAAAALAFLVGYQMQCGSAAEVRSWRHGIVQPKGDAGFVTMVKEGGFAEREGLALELVPLQNDTLLVKALLAGEIDSYQAGPGATLIAASRGAALRIIGCSWVALPQAVFVRDGIASVADLRGKSLAISAPGAQADLLARVLLRKHGVAPEDVRFVDMGSDADRFKALVAGKADAAISSVEFSAQADANGVRTLLSARDIASDLVRYCEVTSTEHAVKDRAWVVRFLAADIAAHRYALANRQAEIDLARKVTGTDTQDARAPSMYDFVLSSRAVDANLTIPADRLARMQQLLVETGNIARPQDLTPLLADDINRAALARADAVASEPVPSGAAAER